MRDTVRGRTIGSAPHGTYTLEIERYQKSVRLEQEREYDFTIMDSARDALCCGYRSGSDEVVSGGIILASGGQYQASESSAFVAPEVDNPGTPVPPPTATPPRVTPPPTPLPVQACGETGTRTRTGCSLFFSHAMIVVSDLAAVPSSSLVVIATSPTITS